MKLKVAIRNFVHTPVKEFQIFNVQPNAGNCEQWAAHLLCIYNYPSIFLLDTEPPMQLTQHCYMTEGTQ